MDKQVTVYSQPFCIYCKMVKEFLDQKEVTYTERNVSEDEEAFAEMEELGLMVSPVTIIDGEAVVGFIQDELEELLAA